MNEFTGKTVEEAIEEGLRALEIDREDATVEVLEEPVKKLFGGKKAVVRITCNKANAKRAAGFLDGLLSLMSIPATAEVVETEEKITINLITTSSSSVIGYRGEVLDSLQCLAGAVANTGCEDYKRTVVDCEGYREKREETLKVLAGRLADKAIKTERKITLEPMNPFERRIIHATLSEREDVTTHSEGREPNRFIVIVPSNLKYDDRKGSGHGNDRRRNTHGKGGHGGQTNKSNGTKKSAPMSWGGTFIGNSLKDGNE